MGFIEKFDKEKANLETKSMKESRSLAKDVKDLPLDVILS